MFTSVTRLSSYMITSSILVALFLGCVVSPLAIRTNQTYALRIYGVKISLDVPPYHFTPSFHHKNNSNDNNLEIEKPNVMKTRLVEDIYLSQLPHGKLRNVMIAYITFVSAGLCLSVIVVILTTLFATMVISQKIIAQVCEGLLVLICLLCIVSLIHALILVLNNNIYSSIINNFSWKEYHWENTQRSNRSAFACNIAATVLSIVMLVANILFPHR